MGRKKKQVKGQAESPGRDKKVTGPDKLSRWEKVPSKLLEAKPDWMSCKPSWSLSKVDLEGPFSWLTVPPDRVKEIAQRAAAWESMTWFEILVKAKKQNHTIKISSLSPDAQSRIRDLKLDDLDGVVSLRLTGPGRIIGARHQNCFTVLWWDPDHQVCISNKK